MEEMQQHNMSWIEVQFLKKAVDVLCLCRQTLMYTYVFAYYLKKNNQSIIFEVSSPPKIYLSIILFKICTSLGCPYVSRTHNYVTILQPMLI